MVTNSAIKKKPILRRVEIIITSLNVVVWGNSILRLLLFECTYKVVLMIDFVVVKLVNLLKKPRQVYLYYK